MCVLSAGHTSLPGHFQSLVSDSGNTLPSAANGQTHGVRSVLNLTGEFDIRCYAIQYRPEQADRTKY